MRSRKTTLLTSGDSFCLITLSKPIYFKIPGPLVAPEWGRLELSETHSRSNTFLKCTISSTILKEIAIGPYASSNRDYNIFNNQIDCWTKDTFARR
jgi:hypothetical protein